MTKHKTSRSWFARLRRAYHHRPIVVLGAAGIVLATLFVIATPLNVAARIGSYPGIGWVLHTYMRNWSRNWSLGEAPPAYVDMADPALVRLGAGYFESGCAPCHGTPGRARNPLVHMMEPPPPSLASRVGDYTDKQLYWILWNGIRYSAMPGWTGADRQEEVWAMVAYLRRYPSLSPQEYLSLAYGDVTPQGVGDGAGMSFGGLDDRLGATVQNCTRCHGADGMGRDGTAPRIAGQTVAYLTATLEGYASGTRASGFMQPIAAGLSHDEIAGLAAHFAAMRPAGGAAAGGAAVNTTTLGEAAAGGASSASVALLSRGRQLASEGDAARFIPACSACHAPNGGIAPRPEYPHIAGQKARFLEGWLRVYRDRPLGGTDYANVMHYAAKGLTDADIDALAAWYASQPYDAGTVQADSAVSSP